MSDFYKSIDSSSLLGYLFYPRSYHSKIPSGAFDISVPVGENVDLVCRAYSGKDTAPWLLYFHGNGEVVADYDSIAPLYTDKGFNLLMTDYRGYGASGGRPTFKSLVEDSKKVFEYVYDNVPGGEKKPDWFVMGRSMGSIAARVLASSYPEQLQGMIIESGFISAAALIDHLGLPVPEGLDLLEEEDRRLTGKITLPALIMHGSQDRLVPLEQGQELFDALGSGQKDLVIISGADHNDIMFVDPEKYMLSISTFIEEVNR